MADAKKSLVKLPKKPNFLAKNSKTPQKNKLGSMLKGVAIYGLIALAALVFLAGISGGGGNSGPEVPISQVVQDVKDGKVQDLKVEGDKVTVDYKQSLPTDAGKGGKTAVSRK